MNDSYLGQNNCIVYQKSSSSSITNTTYIVLFTYAYECDDTCDDFVSIGEGKVQTFTLAYIPTRNMFTNDSQEMKCAQKSLFYCKTSCELFERSQCRMPYLDEDLLKVRISDTISNYYDVYYSCD